MNKINKYSYLTRMATGAAVFASTVLIGCGNNNTGEQKLPILGEREVVEREVNGQTVADTLYPEIPEFAFVDQDSQQVTNETFAGKIYVTDFFFTTCPTICPKMKSQLLRVYEQFEDTPQVMLLSHTIDPQHDSVAVLNEYAARLGVNSDKWRFVTGEKDSIYSVAQKYLVSAMEDESEAGGFVHSGAFVLVDENRHIRGIYDGTDAAQVDRLINDIPVLLQEENNEKK
ncbi:SCO family protein [Pontibacter silvestris]|uniref:SCO family protein n=1 Tax=Pontibacter silvestris TaxID=2305183 RepID=A0ABW4WWU2_9BACT|nr:SCO family protein [Pontibacter silvestris]MCC9136888.1 SCO family protein [Pontibacter silvestris]